MFCVVLFANCAGVMPVCLWVSFLCHVLCLFFAVFGYLYLLLVVAHAIADEAEDAIEHAEEDEYWLPGAGNEEEQVDEDSLGNAHGTEVEGVLQQKLHEEKACRSCHEPSRITEHLARRCAHGQEKGECEGEQCHRQHSAKLYLFNSHSGRKVTFFSENTGERVCKNYN